MKKMMNTTVVLNYNKKPNAPKMINNICNYLPRTNLIIDKTKLLLDEGRKVLILSDRREHLKIKTLLDERTNYCGYYVEEWRMWTK